ncbi:MAG: hypothetical protein KDB03_26035 [Planctomycetales bacterium]|nr:hypothetical protein [Planctomycetales bacterium]
MSVQIEGQVVVGIDGGGSRTKACLARFDRFGLSPVLGLGDAGPSNLHSVGFEIATSNVESAIHNAFTEGGVARQRIDALCLCMAGAGRPTEQAMWLNWSASHQVAKFTNVYPDSMAVLAGGQWHSPDNVDGTIDANSLNLLESLEGVCLISGTGSLAWGIGPDGRSARSGGWGPILGDDGSGYAIGVQALKACLAASDGRGENTQLLQPILDACRLTRIDEIIQWLDANGNRREEVASLAKLVFVLAAKGDPTAMRIFDSAAKDLAALVRGVCGQLQLGKGTYRLSLSGSVLVRQEGFSRRVYEKLLQMGIEPRVISTVRRPEIGALMLAARGLLMGR